MKFEELARIIAEEHGRTCSRTILEKELHACGFSPSDHNVQRISDMISNILDEAWRMWDERQPYPAGPDVVPDIETKDIPH